MEDSHSLERSFRVAPSKLQQGLLLAGVLAAIGLAAWFLMPDSGGQSRWIAAINFSLALFVLITVWRKARDRRPAMTLGAQGVWFHEWDIQKVPWREIRGAHVTGSRIQSFACIELRDSASWLASLPASQGRRSERNRLIRPPCLLIPNGAIDVPLHELVSLVEAGCARNLSPAAG